MSVRPSRPHWWTFLSEFREGFATTGAVLPSSRFLADKLVRGLEKSPGLARVLEVGPGTGAVTDAILRQLRPGDQLVLVELNERFVEVLHRRLGHEPLWTSKKDQLEIRHGSAMDLPAGEKYHAIVCGLPFNNFDPVLVRQLLELLLDRLLPGGQLSFFEYLAIRRLKAPFVGWKERRRLREVAKVIRTMPLGVTARKAIVGRNVPPAVVHYWNVP